MADEQELSERLQGIADALTVRAATLIATSVRARLKPEDMDELRMYIGTAVRGAALEGARDPARTLGELVPVPKTTRAHARQLAITHLRDTPETPITKHYRAHKLPGGV